MPYLDKRNPYNPGYALPGNVLDEPFGRGVLVSKGLPRKTISTLQPDWLETGRQAMGHTEGVFADGHGKGGGGIFSSPAGQGVLGSAHSEGIFADGHGKGGGGIFSSPAGQGVLGGNILDAKIGGSGDPIAEFGKQGAALVMQGVKGVPIAARKEMMKAILDSIDTKLYTMVADRTEKLQKEKGYPAALAMEKALAAAFANRYLAQLVDIGKQGPEAGMKGLVGLGTAHGQCRCCQNLERHIAMGGLWGTLKGFGKKVVGIPYAAGKKVLKGLGKLACVASSSGALTAVAAAGGTVAGGPIGGSAGAKGAAIASALCAKKGPGAMVSEEEIEAAMEAKKIKAGFPVLPVVIGGGALLLAVMLLRRRA